MNNRYFEPIECGETIPIKNPHAFSVSMPTVQNVIDYEEETEEIQTKIKSAYPRIVFHPYIAKIAELASKYLKLDSFYIFVLPDIEVAERVASLSKTEPEYKPYKDYTLALFNIEDKDNIKKYYNLMKHCGYMVFSREAEDFLIKEGVDINLFQENYYSGDSEEQIKAVLAMGYSTNDILLTNCGMNAIYAGFETVKKHEEENGKDIVIQYGWAYSDTLQIFQKCTKRLMVIEDVSNTAKLVKFLEKKGDRVGVLYLETISNPLIGIPDIVEVYELSKKYDFKILIDNTFATPWSVDITSYCDLIFESLTKFASGHGDIMAGAVIRPEKSRLSSVILNDIKPLTIPLYYRVKDRLAYTIGNYKARVEKIEKNTQVIAEFLKNHPMVESLYTVQNSKFVNNWNRIAKDGFEYVGVISVVFKGELEKVYNKLNMPKGPSLGAEFPVVMAYTLLAHYFDTKTKYGLSYLNKIGLSPKLLRFSIGVDDPQLTINSLKSALGET